MLLNLKYFPRNVVVIGKLESMDSTQIAAFENFRNSLNNVQILTFDELYQRVVDLIAVLSEDSTISHIDQYEDESEDLPF